MARSDRGGWRTTGRLEQLWGLRGVSPGRMQKPRAMAIDDQDRLYIVDTTARIQVFDRKGQFLHGWQTPKFANGKPTGLSFSRDGLLMVADTQVLARLGHLSQRPRLQPIRIDLRPPPAQQL